MPDDNQTNQGTKNNQQGSSSDGTVVDPKTQTPVAPAVPAPAVPAPAVPVTPAVAPVAPAPVTPTPVAPTPVAPAPVAPAPVAPAPAPVTPAPVVPAVAPVAPAPVVPAVAAAPVAPVAPAPVTPAPVDPAEELNNKTSSDSDGDIKIDPNKSNEQYIAEVEKSYIVPSLVRNKFPDLVKLIYETESMNHEEREYWLQIMPIMSEEQIVKFREILVNEKEQLSRLDKEYKSEMSKLNKGSSKPIDEAKLKQQMDTIKKAEAASQSTEEDEEAKLLD